MSSPANLEVTYLKNYRPTNYQADSVHLYFNLLDTCAEVTSTVRYSQRTGFANRLELDGKDFEVLSIELDGANAKDIEKTDKGITLSNLPASFELKVKTRLKPDENKSFMGLYKSETLYCTQMESQGFRLVTYFLDRPDVLSVYTTQIEADAAKFPQLLANGNLIKTETLAGGRHVTTWQDPFPKPAYLFALVAGNLDVLSDTFVTQSGKKVDLKIFTEKGQIDRCAFAMEALKRSMKWDEVRFGREYDLDLFMIVAVRDFNFGAMENKGLNIFNSAALLATPETTTDSKFESIEAIIGHEYFHNWSGNRVTCRDWFQLCLKEGFTVYRDQEFTGDQGSAGLQRVKDVAALRDKQFAEDGGPLAHSVRPESFVSIDNFYTGTIYEKGAELIRMQTQLLGWETFRKGSDLYFSRFDGQAVTMEDFVKCMEEVSGRDLSQFWRWYQQAGTPTLKLTRGQTASGDLSVTISQHTAPTPGQSQKLPFHMPFKIGFLDTSGRELSATMLEITQAEETFTFAGIPHDAVISPLREFTAPVNLQWEASTQDLETLIQFDSDAFNAWEAWQKLFRDEFGALIKTQNIEASAQKLARILLGAVKNHKKDPAFAKEFFGLPSLIDLQKDFGQAFSFDGIVLTREELLRQMSSILRADLLSLYQECAAMEVATPPKARGYRALKNVALSLAVVSGDTSALALASAQLKNAANMTDESAALAMLNRRTGRARDEGNAHFYNKWKSEPLIIDTWHAIKNLCSDAEVLDEIEALQQSPEGKITNPNRNRAIYASVAFNNPKLFHERQGRGYQLIAKRVLEIDKFNPQLAARLAGTFADVGIMDNARKALVVKEATGILGEKISENLREIVSKVPESLATN